MKNFVLAGQNFTQSTLINSKNNIINTEFIIKLEEKYNVQISNRYLLYLLRFFRKGINKKYMLPKN